MVLRNVSGCVRSMEVDRKECMLPGLHEALTQQEAFLRTPAILDDRGRLVSFSHIDERGVWGLRKGGKKPRLILKRDPTSQYGSGRPHGSPAFVVVFGACFERAKPRVGEKLTLQRKRDLIRENKRRERNVTPAWRRWNAIEGSLNGFVVTVPNSCGVHSASYLCWADIPFEIPGTVKVTGLGVWTG